jgi:DNA-binding transcriptional MerR regulator
VTKTGFEQVARDCGVAVELLTVWVDRRWVRPERSGAELNFTDADRARLRMIVEFQRDLAIDDDAMAVVLAIAELPETARVAVVRQLQGEGHT